jgi:PTS system cellobiose-specific IIC component
VFACFAIAHDFAGRLGLDAAGSALLATLCFLLLQVKPGAPGLDPAALGSAGLFTAIVVALVAVRVKAWFVARGLVIRLPGEVPAVVAESFLSLVPLLALAAGFWALRFLLGLDLNAAVQAAFAPLVFALDTLPGILVYALLVTLLWSVGVNGDNTLDAVVAPVFLQFLAANVAALAEGRPPPHITANGFFSTFVNVGGTGATLGLALVLWRSRDPGLRQVARVSLPTQVFQINEPIFFGVPIVLNPLLMVPYILNALLLTAGTYALMSAGLIARPVLNIPWTTPPVIGHYLVTGGDWRAALWGVVSLALATLVYLPFARALERSRRAAAARPEDSGR